MKDVNKEDVIWVLKDILEEDIPYWDLDPDEGRGLNGDQRKDWYVNCMREAIKIVKNSN